MTTSPAEGARIGPNAVLRLVEALDHAAADKLTVFAAAGLSAYLDTPPTTMVPEADVIALYAALRRVVGDREAHAIAHDAGERTARYLLTHRIPKPAQAVLKALPARLAARLLLTLVARHAWTFAGSSALEIVHGRPSRVVFTDSPMARGASATAPVCDFYAGTFEELFRALVAPSATARETACAAMGAPVCTLTLTW
jgi:divinyl protochlorophyllide a 8-vinyl-reductase